MHAALASLLTLGCTSGEPTQIFLTIDSDLVVSDDPTRRELDTIRVRAHHLVEEGSSPLVLDERRGTPAADVAEHQIVRIGEHLYESRWQEDFPLGPRTLPIEIGTAPLGGDLSRIAYFEALALRDGEVVVRTAVRTRFVERSSVRIILWLTAPCVDVECSPESVCRDGRCVSVDVDPDCLPSAGADAGMGATRCDVTGDAGVSDGGCVATCGDGACECDETGATCPGDCPTSCSCGDGACNCGEDDATCSTDCPPGCACGDGTCSCGETSGSCCDDCGASCGDGACNCGETEASCCSDCGTCGPVCGDGSCESGERSSCCADCQQCGDGRCNCGETSGSCSSDCGPACSCGDGACNCGETSGSCCGDCGGCGPVCGDGGCNGGENSVSCCGDCGSVCGDGTCNCGENSGNCCGDCGGCGPVCGDGSCEVGMGETFCTCTSDCVGGWCNNGVCEPGESSCAADCSRCGDGSCRCGETQDSCIADCCFIPPCPV